ncbi:MAG: permease, partial [Candidatus Gracilibacteria bacterium]|nr:permease [Candidatus Gracilibacteria bacterium]
MFKFLADFITFKLLGFSAEDHLGNVLNFFIYDSIKILVLIMVVIFLISFFRTFVSAKMTDKLRGGGFGLPNFFAALFGAITPFCSCSSIPLFVGFLKSGINPGVAFSFLITSPLVNEVALVMMVALFGWQTAFWYGFAGITLGTVGG